MKVGDKIICRKSYPFNDGYAIQKGHRYSIVSAFWNSFSCSTEFEGVLLHFYRDEDKNIDKFKDYFFTIKECRKFKLEKIYESR